jgi:hypothetical protein
MKPVGAGVGDRVSTAGASRATGGKASAEKGESPGGESLPELPATPGSSARRRPGSPGQC